MEPDGNGRGPRRGVTALGASPPIRGQMISSGCMESARALLRSSNRLPPPSRRACPQPKQEAEAERQRDAARRDAARLRAAAEQQQQEQQEPWSQNRADVGDVADVAAVAAVADVGPIL
eukprot:gene15962-biopygen1176